MWDGANVDPQRILEHNRLLGFFRDYYLSWAAKDPKAAERYIACLQALGNGTQDEVARAWEVHFLDPNDPLHAVAERFLTRYGSGATIAAMEQFAAGEIQESM